LEAGEARQKEVMLSHEAVFWFAAPAGKKSCSDGVSFLNSSTGWQYGWEMNARNATLIYGLPTVLITSTPSSVTSNTCQPFGTKHTKSLTHVRPACTLSMSTTKQAAPLMLRVVLLFQGNTCLDVFADMRFYIAVFSFMKFCSQERLSRAMDCVRGNFRLSRSGRRRTFGGLTTILGLADSHDVV